MKRFRLVAAVTVMAMFVLAPARANAAPDATFTTTADVTVDLTNNPPTVANANPPLSTAAKNLSGVCVQDQAAYFQFDLSTVATNATAVTISIPLLPGGVGTNFTAQLATVASTPTSISETPGSTAPAIGALLGSPVTVVNAGTPNPATLTFTSSSDIVAYVNSHKGGNVIFALVVTCGTNQAVSLGAQDKQTSM